MKYKYHFKDSNFKRIIAFTPENKAKLKTFYLI